MCAGCKQSATKRGATTVLSTLVSNAREVFKVLAAQQLEDPTAAGVSFPMLLRVVRERYIIMAEHALKSVLAEFRDHELIKFRAGPDGGEVMYIPMEEDMLRGALQDMQAAEAE
jgi:origin recognition complex subunit 2